MTPVVIGTGRPKPKMVCCRGGGLKKAVEETIQWTGAEVELLSRNIQAIPERAQRLDAVASDYLSRSPELRKRTLVLTASNADRRALNDRIRRGLFADGTLSGPERNANILVSKDLTRAEIRESASYNVGDVVRFGRSYSRLGVSKGDYCFVTDRNLDVNAICLTDERGRTLAWRPHRAPHVEVYNKDVRSLAAGDLIRFTRNDKDKHRRNGEVARVLSISGDSAILSAHGKKQRIDLSIERHWEHGYASTVHSAQGRTADAAILHLDTSRSKLTGHESWYVALSRAREDVRVYVDDPPGGRTRCGKNSSPA